MMKHILTFTDFSTLSDYSIQFAMAFAKTNNASLSIYHQLEHKEQFKIDLSMYMDIDYKDSEDLSKKQLINHWRQKAIELDVDTHLIISGDPMVNSIKSLVEDEAVDFIIMATTSEYERTDSHWYSNTQTVIKEVDCPVLVLKDEKHNTSFNKVVFASAFNQEDKKVFQYFLDFFPLKKNTQIHLLSVDSSSSFGQPNVVMQDVMKEFEEMAPNYHVESTFYSDFTIDTGIRDFVREVNPDLLVMGNKFRKPLKHFIQGNHALWNVARVDCPVLTIDFKDEPVHNTN